MASDFHTHHPGSAAPALVSCGPEEIGRHPLASLELHPWHLPETVVPFDEAFVSAAHHAAALGEAGLDRLRGPSLAVQRRYFAQLLELAEALKKPVVCHCVRAFPELLAEWKRFPEVRGLIHGFHGGAALFDDLLTRGFYVSLGSAALKNAGMMEVLKHRGLEHVGFETDDSGKPVEELLARAADCLALPPLQLERQTDRTFREFLNL